MVLATSQKVSRSEIVPTFGFPPQMGEGSLVSCPPCGQKRCFWSWGGREAHHRSFWGREARGLVEEAPGNGYKVLGAREFHAKSWRALDASACGLLWRR